MSIYASRLEISDEEHDLECAQWAQVEDGQPWHMATTDGRYFRRERRTPCTCGKLAPIAYLGSHVRIAPDAQRDGCVSTAHIPPWCAYGVTDPDSVDEDGPPAPFLRLSVDGYDWRENTDTSATAVLDAGQVERLRYDLTRWLDSLAPGERPA